MMFVSNNNLIDRLYHAVPQNINKKTSQTKSF